MTGDMAVRLVIHGKPHYLTIEEAQELRDWLLMQPSVTVENVTRVVVQQPVPVERGPDPIHDALLVMRETHEQRRRKGLRRGPKARRTAKNMTRGK